MSARRRCRRTRKRRFRDRIAAELALAGIRHPATPDRAKTPRRTYRCPFCTGWHLTSQPLRTPAAGKDPRP